MSGAETAAPITTPDRTRNFIMAKSEGKTRPKSSATRSESIRAWQASRTPEERSASAKKAAQVRESNRAKAAPGDAAPKKATPAQPERSGVASDAAKRRSEASKRGWAKRRVEGTKRERLAREMAAAAARTQVDWRSEMDYIREPPGGTFAQWGADWADAAEADAAAAGAEPMAGPWRVQGSVEGERKGAGTFDVVLAGTKHERIVELIAAVVAAAESGGVSGVDPTPKTAGKGRGGRGKASKPANADAEKARAEAVEKYSAAGDKDAAQSIRISTLTAPEGSSAWRVYEDDVPF